MTDSTGSLQFETAGSVASTSSCTVCSQPLSRTYFTLNGNVACPACKTKVAETLGQRLTGTGVMKSLVMGSIPGAIGAIVWWAVRRFASLEIGLIAIGIGHFVGLGVRNGSGGRGGRSMQVLAVLLTYFWITANYVPDVIQAVVSPETEATEQGSATSSDGATPADTTAAAPPATADASETSPADTVDAEDVSPTLAQMAMAIAFLVGIALAAPFLQGVENVIGLAIIAFGLWQAWKLNARHVITVEGPFKLEATQPPPIPSV